MQQRKIRPTKKEIIKQTNSIVHWDTLKQRILYKRENRLSLFITCGMCKQKRIVAINNLERLKAKNRFTGLCKNCFRNASYKLRGRPRNFKKVITNHGYIKLYQPENPMADKRGEIYEHRLIMSQILNRPLESWEIVHHKDGNKLNNSPENLELYPKFNSEHESINRMRRRIKQLEKLLNQHNIQIPPFDYKNL